MANYSDGAFRRVWSHGLLNLFKNGAFLDFYDGDLPVSANLAQTGNLLARVTLPDDPFTAIDLNTINISAPWISTFGDVRKAGTPIYARILTADDPNQTDLTATYARIDIPIRSNVDLSAYTWRDPGTTGSALANLEVAYLSTESTWAYYRDNTGVLLGPINANGEMILNLDVFQMNTIIQINSILISSFGGGNGGSLIDSPAITHGRGPTSSRPIPSLSNDGWIYFDTTLDLLLRSNGTAWEDIGGSLGFTPIDSALLGVPGGVATLDSTLGTLTSTQVPASLLGALIYRGTWDATLNVPTITPADSTNLGWYYVVQTAGSTDINGITDWKLGDWIISNGVTWEKIDNTDQVVSVNSFQGAVNLTTDTVPEIVPGPPVNLYFTEDRAINSLLSSFTTSPPGGEVTNSDSIVSAIEKLSYRRRLQANYITPLIASNEYDATHTLDLCQTATLTRITASNPCWVRIYTSDAYRSMDNSRLINTDPLQNHGVALDAVMTSSLTLDLSPIMIFANQDFLSGGQNDIKAYLSIQNLDSVSAAIDITLTYLPIEQYTVQLM